jgi:hypothetical protein
MKCFLWIVGFGFFCLALIKGLILQEFWWSLREWTQNLMSDNVSQLSPLIMGMPFYPKFPSDWASLNELGSYGLSLVSLSLYFVPAWFISKLERRDNDKGDQDGQNIQIHGDGNFINADNSHNQIREKDERGRWTGLMQGLFAVLTAIFDKFLK